MTKPLNVGSLIIFFLVTLRPSQLATKSESWGEKAAVLLFKGTDWTGSQRCDHGRHEDHGAAEAPSLRLWFLTFGSRAQSSAFLKAFHVTWLQPQVRTTAFKTWSWKCVRQSVYPRTAQGKTQDYKVAFIQRPLSLSLLIQSSSSPGFYQGSRVMCKERDSNQPV